MKLEMIVDLPFEFLQKHVVNKHLSVILLLLKVIAILDKKNRLVFEATHFKSRAFIKKVTF